MAGVDSAVVRIRGRGGHGAAPQETVDPVLAAAHVVTALQSIVARNFDPLDAGVVTVASIHGGEAANVIPEWVVLKLTTRSFRPELRSLLQQRVPALIRAQAESFGAEAEVDYRLGFPAVVNQPAETEFAAAVARDTFRSGVIIEDFRPRMASEDFAYLLEKKPGCFLLSARATGRRCTARRTISTTASWAWPRPSGYASPSAFCPDPPRPP